MTRKKSRTKPPSKKQIPKLDKEFTCPFCNHSGSVECIMDRKLRIGTVECGICLESFSTKINALYEPIDLYSEWIDECERVNSFEDEATYR